MKNISEYRKFKYEKENLITENTEFFQYQFGQGITSPIAGYGFAVDPSSSVFSTQDTMYSDFYQRSMMLVNDLKSIIDIFNKDRNSIAAQKFDYFIDELDEYQNLKILRMKINESNYIDVYISFEFRGDEYFGVYKNFNKPYTLPKLSCELFKNTQYNHIDMEYRLKLSNYFRKILNNWFIPSKGNWRNLKDGYLVKNSMGKKIPLKNGVLFKIEGYNIDENNNPYLIISIKDEEFFITGNDFYWFNWYCEKIK